MESKRNIEKIITTGHTRHKELKSKSEKKQKRADARAETDHVARRLVFLIYSGV